MRKLSSARSRRGNTMILVTGILVLLVIIATAFVTRTNAGRDTATAVRQSETRDAGASTIAHSLAYEVSVALFPFPVDQNFSPIGSVASSNDPRLSPTLNPIRYGIDQDTNNDGEPDHPYNIAPFQTVPWTNWPDPSALDPNWPTLDPSSFSSAGLNLYSVFGIGEGNPRGGPGFGDSRWLRDIEAMRVDMNGDGFAESSGHIRHMTNIARPNNGHIPLVDISNVEASAGWFLNDATGGNGPIYHIPIEQWLPVLPAPLVFGTGDVDYSSIYSNPNDWADLANGTGHWLNWFSPQYSNMYATTGINGAPHNRYRLRSLGPPQDEFIAGTDRWSVSRTLVDTDGDGYTDAYWFLPPTPVVNGIRTAVAVSIIDNQGMLNANVATRFSPNDGAAGPSSLRKTRGLVASDLALFGDLLAPNNNNPTPFRYTGFYDNPNHDVQWFAPFFGIGYQNLGYDRQLWARHTAETGLGITGALQTPNLADRLDYWQRNGRYALESPEAGYAPFSMADEIELRMFAGNNSPWIRTRYENSVEVPGTTTVNNGFPATGLLHADLGFEESSEFRDQLNGRMQLAEQRHRLTLYNNVRNDIMPPWLWATQFPIDADLSGFIEADERLAFELRRRKFDLRGRLDYSLYYNNSSPGVDTLGVGSADRAAARELVRDIAERAFVDDLSNAAQSYFGPPATQIAATPAPLTALQASLMAAAGFAANLDAFRDVDATVDLRDAVEVTALLPPPPDRSRMLPIEAQPFIVEAFIAHVYSGSDIPDQDSTGIAYSNSDEYVLFDDDQTTIVVVQLANPFDRSIDLRNYKLSVFGQELDFNNVPAGVNTVLPSANGIERSTAIIFAAEPVVNGDNIKERWLDFLDIEEMTAAVDPTVTALPGATTLRIDLTDILGSGGFSSFVNPWSTDRAHYDTTTSQSVVLKRVITSAVAPVDVVVDRIDNTTTPEFRDAVIGAGDPMFGGPKPSPLNLPAGPVYPGHTLGVDINNNPYTHWVQYFRATRAWGFDVNGNGAYDPAEQNPRYVFGNVAVMTAEADATAGGDGTPHSKFDDGGGGFEGAKYNFDTSPDMGPGSGALNGWFARTYHAVDSSDTTANIITTRKPTFFNTGTGFATIPDKGWYGQGDTVDLPPIDNAGSYRTRLSFAMQMMQKDADIEQIGEVLNVWLFGHELVFITDPFSGNSIFASSRADDGTRRTFSEFMADEDLVGAWDNTNPALADFERIRVNRLRTRPTARPGGIIGDVIGAGNPANAFDTRHRQAALPAGVRLLSAFVCDDRGINAAPDLNLDGFSDSTRDRELAHLFNANGFTGRGTPGLINLNTASPEVARATPHMYRLTHEVKSIATNPRTMVAEAMMLYRDGLSGDPGLPSSQPWVSTGTVITPGWTGAPGTQFHYGNRQLINDLTPLNDIRSERGMASIGEVLLVNRSAPNFSQDPMHGFILEADLWRADLNSASDTYWPYDDGSGNAESIIVSTDVNDEFDIATNSEQPDDVAKDAEEANLLFSGLSNLATVRSDTFTVYFRIRSFRQNPNTLVWDATDPEYIVDDSRYVMLVDRSEVNHPSDRPKILYVEKLPN